MSGYNGTLAGPTSNATHAVMVLPESPYPPMCGNALRDVQQVTLLRRLGYEVTLLCVRPRTDSSAAADRRAAARHSGAIEFVSEKILDFHESRLAVACRKVGYLRRANAAHPFSWWCAPYALPRVLPQRLVALAPDVVMLRSLFLDLIPVLRARVGGRLIVDCHDADSHLAREMIHSVPWWRKLGLLANYQGVRTICETALPLADEIWAVSAEDAARIRPHAGLTRVLVVPSGVDETAVAASAAAGEDDICAMVANYDYGPNLNAARWLVKRVWPRVRHARPAGKLLLVGGGSERVMRSLAAGGNDIEVTGALADLTPIHARAGVMLAPLQQGGGSRLKIIEAWKHGKAVLTTSKGIEGISAPPGVATIRDGTEAFTEALVSLMTSRPQRNQLGEAGRRFVATHLSFARVEQALRSASILGRGQSGCRLGGGALDEVH